MSSARILGLAVLLVTSACSVRTHECGILFDRLKGKGPVMIEPNDDAVASTKFFNETWQSSATVKHLVTQRGAPEAISVEREFLKPNRLKLFYPGQGQVYILDMHEGEWLVSGSEPIVHSDFEQLTRQRATLTQSKSDTVRVEQVLPRRVEAVPVAHVAPADFRGRLKPPAVAAVARLSKRDARTYLHTVTFRGEDLGVLADWYTESAGNAGRLAALNRLSVSAPLRIGEEIAIPSSLMRNPEPLPEALVP